MSENVTLADPGYPATDLTEIGYQLIYNCGFTIFVYGQGTAADCFATVKAAAPSFQTTRALPSGLANLGGRDDSCFLFFEGDRGALLAYSIFPNGDSHFSTTAVLQPFDRLPKSWVRGIGTVNAVVPPEVASIFATARAVAIWDIPGLEQLHPNPASRQPLPEPFLQRLSADGWERTDNDIFKATVSTKDGRSQLVFLAQWNPSTLAIFSPIADSPDGTIPQRLRGNTFDGYDLDVLADMVVLVNKIPFGIPTPEIDVLRAEAITLATYADRVEADLSSEDKY